MRRIFLGSCYRNELLVLDAPGIVQWMPFYSRVLYSPAITSFRSPAL